MHTLAQTDSKSSRKRSNGEGSMSEAKGKRTTSVPKLSSQSGGAATALDGGTDGCGDRGPRAGGVEL